MIVKEIVRAYLEENGYDGLYNEDEDGCGCGLEDMDDFMPCNGEKDIRKCISAYEHEDGMFYVYKVVE